MAVEDKALVTKVIKDSFDFEVYNDVLNVIWEYTEDIELREMDILNDELFETWDNGRIITFNKWLMDAYYIDFAGIKTDAVDIGTEGLIYKGFFSNNELNENDFKEFMLIIDDLYKKIDNND
mmetsp:Transcript_64818/g.58233  ORF Transcript_64818/g.58233 Transcript_64818/m.58233 type:complete len:122 (-) Transcript_64818:597-962(-)|eukprot:CAMPEP_0201585730 /NCGR_PEP_ID=MMETSP0190_2-20130828/124984_1 /ASSEMBLY_ACC=CAM_ASM_000263 /TAXON_ID=37353 /ORGANISM="Rosalina sp." /LENGTH=121 /DNA_ID=CAMNT_0048032237 /DNA_START=28 /DNA_END=393 /DNA_ORIENTATION=+